MRTTSLVLLAGLASIVAVAPADAQTSRHHRYEPRHHEPHRGTRTAPRQSVRAPVRPAPSQGPFPIIHWNTPNADGNFGGPGAGGAGPGA